MSDGGVDMDVRGEVTSVPGSKVKEWNSCGTCGDLKSDSDVYPGMSKSTTWWWFVIGWECGVGNEV